MILIAMKQFDFSLEAAKLLALFAILIVSWGPNAANTSPAKSNDQQQQNQKQKEYFQKPGVKVSEIIRARGYLAEEHTITTDDGYVLGMTRALNPLIGLKKRQQLRREPLLFVHGTLVDGNSFVMNSFDIDEPKDYSDLVDADQFSESELIELFEEEPAAKSLAFFALNFGHEIWFLHRRGSPLSQKRVNLSRRNSSNKFVRKPATVMEKYLASVDAYIERERTKRRTLRMRHERNRRSASGEPDGTTNATRLTSFDSDVNDANSSASSPELSNEEEAEETLAATRKPTKKDHSKVVEALEAAPAALADYGNLAMDIKVTQDKRLWNHSFDEQAAYDLPRAIDYVLEQSGHERAVVVGDSSGGALIIMSLVLEPKLNDKLSKAIAWVPSFNIGHTQNSETFSLIQPLFNYLGPFPFTFASAPFQALMEVACSLEVMQVTLCTLATDLNWGSSAGKAVLRPEFQSAYMTPVSAHEYLQLIQFVIKKQTRMFDFGDKQKNLLVYGRDEPPYYNVSLISFEHLSIYVGTSDTLVTTKDINTIHNELRVPHRIRVMDQPGVNHGGALFHEQVARIVIIPTYKDIISHGYKASRSASLNRNQLRNTKKKGHRQQVRAT